MKSTIALSLDPHDSITDSYRFMSTAWIKKTYF